MFLDTTTSLNNFLYGSGSMPSNSYINNIFPNPITTVQQTYTAPADGYIQITNNSTTGVWLYTKSFTRGVLISNTAGGMFTSPLLPVRKGDVVRAFTGSGTVTLTDPRFIYAQGGV